MYNSVDIWLWKYFASVFFSLFLFFFLLLIDAFTRVNICVNKCSFFCVHVYAIDGDALSMCTHISIHTYTYYRIVIKASRMHAYFSISLCLSLSLFSVVTMNKRVCTYMHVLYYSHIVEMLRKITRV